MIDVKSDIHNPQFNTGDIVCFKNRKDVPCRVSSKEWVGKGNNGAWFYHFASEINYGFEYELELYNKPVITNGWISVKDEIPDSHVKVIFTDGVNVYVGNRKYFPKNSLWIIDSTKEAIFNVTHWMKIPKIPE